MKNIRATRLQNHTRTEHEIKRTLLGWTCPLACSHLDVPTKPDVPRRLFATVKPLRKSAGMPKGDQKPKFWKQPGFEHLPQEAQPRLVCNKLFRAFWTSNRMFARKPLSELPTCSLPVKDDRQKSKTFLYKISV